MKPFEKLWCALCGVRIDEDAEGNENDFDLCDICVSLPCGRCSGDEPCHDCIRERMEYERQEIAESREDERW